MAEIILDKLVLSMLSKALKSIKMISLDNFLCNEIHC